MVKRFVCAAVLVLGLPVSGALAQSVGGVSGGMNSNNRSMSGANIDVDNGMLANGTPKQQSPGVSMTNGPATSAGQSATLNGDGTPQPGGAAALPPKTMPVPTVNGQPSGQ